MMGLVVTWLFKPWVQLALGLLVLFGLWQADRWSYGRKAVREHVEYSKEVGKINAEKSDEAHSAARKPGAFERLRNDPATCRNCR